jgi:hypothetical protein
MVSVTGNTLEIVGPGLGGAECDEKDPVRPTVMASRTRRVATRVPEEGNITGALIRGAKRPAFLAGGWFLSHGIPPVNRKPILPIPKQSLSGKT